MAAPQHAPASLEHVWPRGTTYDDRGVLQLGGCDALELAREFGTPAFIVVEDDVRSRAREILDAFARHAGPDHEVHFASKAFPSTAILRLLAEEGLACDVAGGGELAVALRAGFEPGRIHLHGNAKTERELREALEAGIGDIVLDNHDELDLLERLLPAGARQRVLLRVAPGVSPDTHPAISTGGPNTKFGFNPEDAARAIERLRAMPDRFDLDGLHMHIGSQILDLAPFRPALEAMASLGEFRTWNLGGGLGVAYTAGQHPPTIDEYVRTKVGLVRELVGEGVRIADEPGRALVANGCVTLYGVQSVKRNVATWVGVDGGMSDNLRPMLYGAQYEARGRRPPRRRHRGPRHRQALRVRRRPGARRAPRRPAARRRARHAGDRRLRLRHGHELQRRPAPAHRLRQGRRRPRRRAARDLRRPPGP